MSLVFGRAGTACEGELGLGGQGMSLVFGGTQVHVSVLTKQKIGVTHGGRVRRQCCGGNEL